MVLYGCLWSLYKDDIQQRFLMPKFFFKYYGFEWVGFVGEAGIYFLYLGWFLAAIGILVGAFYRISIWIFFIIFTYLQLIDATNYINHYYAISIFALFLALLPANVAFSIDIWRKPELLKSKIPYAYIFVFQLQIAVIYTFASIAKMNPDWLFRAMPLKIWLLQSQDFPIIGFLFQYNGVHFAMSWIGMLFDLTIVWFLWCDKTRKWAYAVLLIFHILTGFLLNIGLFPILMILTTTVFFAPSTHEKFLSFLGGFCTGVRHLWVGKAQSECPTPFGDKVIINKGLKYFFIIHFIIQILLPLRHHVLYTGNPLWTEEGYNFSWWVMLLEKDGVATFYVEDPKTGMIWEVDNQEFLTPFQEKRMAIRPDHILQFAHYLGKEYSKKYKILNPIVRADVHVTMNGRVSQQLIDPRVDLTKKKRSIWQKDFVNLMI